MSLDPKLLEILACPEDKGPLLYFEDEQVLYNPRLKRKYEIRDGTGVGVGAPQFGARRGFFVGLSQAL